MEEQALLSKEKVMEMTSLSSSTIWRMMKENKFPKSVQATMRRAAWRKSDIDQWILSRQ